MTTGMVAAGMVLVSMVAVGPKNEAGMPGPAMVAQGGAAREVRHHGRAHARDRYGRGERA